jgi:hypothetical protein
MGGGIKFTIITSPALKETPAERKERARKLAGQGKRSQVFKDKKDFKRNPKHKGKGFE